MNNAFPIHEAVHVEPVEYMTCPKCGMEVYKKRPECVKLLDHTCGVISDEEERKLRSKDRRKALLNIYTPYELQKMREFENLVTDKTSKRDMAEGENEL